MGKPSRLRELAALSYVSEQISYMADLDDVKRSSSEFPFIRRVTYNIMGKIQTFDSENISLNVIRFPNPIRRNFSNIIQSVVGSRCDEQ